MMYEDVQSVLTSVTTSPPTLPSEAQLVLLCLDYLRDLRRAFSTESDDLLLAEGLDGDYITLAIWALSRSFAKPKELQVPSDYACVSEEVKNDQVEAFANSNNGQQQRINLSAWGNDPWFELEHADPTLLQSRNSYEDFETIPISDRIRIPDLQQMEKEVIYSSCPNADKIPGNEGKYHEDYQMYPIHWYDHDEMHHSNAHRFYTHGGLNNGPPITLAELASAGLNGLKARSRLDADKDIKLSPLFTQFVKAVESKGFFQIDDEQMTEELYNERFNKVVAKFRSKLANKAKQQLTTENEQSTDCQQHTPLPVYREQSPNYEDTSNSSSGAMLSSIENVKNHRNTMQLSKMRSPPFTTPPRQKREESRQVVNTSTSKQQHHLQRTPPLHRQNVGNSQYGEHVDKESINKPYSANKEKSSRSNSVPRGTVQPYDANKSNHHHYEESRDDSFSYGMETSSNQNNNHNRHRQQQHSRDWDDDDVRDTIDHREFMSRTKSESDFSDRHPYDLKRSSSRVSSVQSYSKPSSSRASSLSRSYSMDHRSVRKNKHTKPTKQSSSRSVTPTPKMRSSKFDESFNSDDDDDDRSIVEMAKAEKLKTNGNQYMQNRDYPSAIEAYTAALLISPVGPNSHVYFSNRAAAYLSLKKFDEAIADSKRSLALKPNYGKAQSRLGLAHFLLGNYEEAVKAYKGAVTNEPNNETSKSYLEKAQQKLEQQQSPKKDKRIRKGRESSKQQQSMTTKSRSESRSHSRMKEKTSRSASRSHSTLKERNDSRARSLRKFDDEVSTVGSLSNRSIVTSEERTIHLRAEKYKIEGNAYMAAKKYEAAVRSYSNALLESSDGIHSHVYYGNRSAALCYLECFDDAEQDALASLELKPRYAKAHARLGLSRYSQGNYVGAIAAYEDSLRYEPDNESARTFLEKSKAKLVKQQKRVDDRRR